MKNYSEITQPFQDFTYLVPEPIVAGQTGVDLRWFFKQIEAEDIEEIRPHCGCTASIEILPDGIKATYSDNSTEKQFANLAGNYYHINKGLNVFVKDGEPMSIINDKGVSVFNPKKKYFVLRFSANVKRP